MNFVEHHAAEITKMDGSYRLGGVKYILERLSKYRGTNLGDCRLFPINLSIDEKELEDIGLQFCSLLGFILGF